jgi:hypothetical protein
MMHFVQSNNGGKMIRKRAPGGGRKPRGDFHDKRAQLTTRVTEATRDALEIAAHKSGRSLSQEVEHRLRESLRSNGNGDKADRALAYLIGDITRLVRLTSQRPWQTNRWLIETVKFAIAELLDRLPATDTERPPNLEAFTPEQLGKSFGLQVSINVARADPDNSVTEDWGSEFGGLGVAKTEELRAGAKLREYTAVDVRRDLEIPFQPRRKKP